ncbi:MAG: hypothetical protein EOM20_06215 [Spartobacteria bacterium]|nr:hypothetical protein [Spartobacteria bacterium]
MAHHWINRIRRYVYKGLTYSRSQNVAAALLAEVYVSQRWREWGVCGQDGGPLRLAVFGGGDHSAWLSMLTHDRGLPGPEVCMVLDDRPDPERTFWGQHPVKPETLNPRDVDAVLISSDTAADRMKARCLALYGPDAHLLDLYEGLPEGPYPKL